MSDGTTVLIPPDGSGAFQSGQGFPGLQPAGTVQYVQYVVGQQYRSPSNPPNQQELLKKLRKVESKALGAIQIIIGLIFIGLGIIEIILFGQYYFPFASIVAYPFWGGIFFIVSGSLAVSAENYPNSTLVKVSVGMNITSAVMAFIGIVLYIVQLAKNNNFKRNDQDRATIVGLGAGTVFSEAKQAICAFPTWFYQTCCLLFRFVFVGWLVFADNSAMTTDPLRRQNGIIAFILPNGADIIQAGQGIHATVGQPPRVAQYIDEQLGSNQPGRKRWVRELEKNVKVEAKTLGAIQIIIGLIEIGFGIVSFFIMDTFYVPLADSALFPCWSGTFFIVSGSISVSTTKYRNRCLVKCNVGAHVTSATAATIGIILYTAQLCLNQPYFFQGYPGSHPERTLLFNKVGNGLCAVLLLFCLLEFCITVPTAHFGCQATCCNKEMDMDLVPIVIVGDDVAPAENNPAPPTYSDTVLSPSVEG
ncbi:uncharacterized protein LOC117041753 [Lacerta agilis]|uniref:uncharacterized protein LOC117041753 n=1 Tax=Lacerta agilis TaxID=80427 RepID=UPI00141A0EA3|nr:uncharacterized protein LOC117041753 [Lacerta agilis]